MKKFLHIGCGVQNKANLKGFSESQWHEVRLDIDPKVNPDILSSFTEMSSVRDNEYDAIFSSHNLEHLFFHEVEVALSEFYRVLNSDGFIVLTCPDLQSVCEAVSRGKLTEPLYQSPAGPISAIDVLFGHRGFISAGNVYMAHKTGFTYQVLDDFFNRGGFQVRAGRRRGDFFDLWIIASKNLRSEEVMRSMAAEFLP